MTRTELIEELVALQSSIEEIGQRMYCLTGQFLGPNAPASDWERLQMETIDAIEEKRTY